MVGGSHRVSVLAKHVLAANPIGSFQGLHEPADYPEGDHFCCFPDSEQVIRCAKAGPLSAEACPVHTFPDLLGVAAKNFPNDIALAVERPLPLPNGPGDAPSLPWNQWKKWTYSQYWEDARKAAKAFMSLGVKQFGSVSIFGFNSPEWVISAFGAMLCGGKYVGIYSTDTADQLAYKMAHSGSGVVVVDSEVEYEKAASRISAAPCLKAIVVWGMQAPTAELKRDDGSLVKVMTWEDLLNLGGSQGDAELDLRIKAMKPGHCIAIIYTSGTTGNPKAVMMSHDNVVAECAVLYCDEIGVKKSYENGPGRVISYLPLSHIAGAVMDFLSPVAIASLYQNSSTVYFARPYDLKEMTLAARIGFAKPTVFFAVPRVFEKMQARMMAVGASLGGVKKSLSTWAKSVGSTYAKNLQLGGSRARPMLHGLADKLVLSKAREAVGLDQASILITGAAPVAVETLDYFGQLGMMIQNVYGMSESAGMTTICTPARQRFGTVGPAPDGVEVKCFQVGPNGENIEVPPTQPHQANLTEKEQGEVCFRGRHIMMGYMANPDFGEEHIKEIQEKNRATIDKWGWLHSGDKGCIDIDGMLKITGRYKELIIGAGGENIAPVPVEENIKLLAPAISNIMMVGDNRKYNIVLVTLQCVGSTGEFPGTDELMPVVKEINPKLSTVTAARTDPKVLKYIQDAIDKTNANESVCQSNSWKVQKFMILPRDFSIETGELTATLKLRRAVAAEIWQKEIDELYKE